MFKKMPPRAAWRLLGGSMVVLALQVVVLFPTTFAPGWANGWPGISKHTVFAGFMTGMVLIAQVAVVVALLAPLCALLERAFKKDYLGWASFLGLSAIGILAALCVCLLAYPTIRSSIASEWP